MDERARPGFTLNTAGEVVDVDPWAVIFNEAMPLAGVAHARGRVPRRRLPGRVGLRVGDAARPARPLPPLGFLIPFTVAAIATPIQMVVGDTLARWVYENEPTKFAAIEMVPKTSSDVPETLFGHLNDDGTVSGGIPIPGLASILSDPADGTSTAIQGLDSFPEDERPTIRQVNTVHLAWDVMVGLGTLLFLLSVWYCGCWVFKQRHAEEQALPLDRVGRRRALGDHDGGRLGRHRGRPPTVDRAQLHEGRGRGHRQRGRVDHVHRGGAALRRGRGRR